jgi:Cytochrome c554 and c-prime
MPRLLPVIILLPLAGFVIVNRPQLSTDERSNPAVEPRMAADNENKFVGAASCVPCHKSQADKQLASNMARAAYSPRQHPLFDRFKNEAARLSGFRFLFLWERDPFEISVSDGVRELRIPAQWALGAGVHGVTFVARLGKGKYLEYLLTYYSHTGRLDFTPGQGDRPFQTLAEAAGQPNSRDEAFRCLSCHTTGSVDPPGADDIRVGELGVRCEACHGPGLLHLEAAKREDWQEARRQKSTTPGDPQPPKFSGFAEVATVSRPRMRSR